MKGVLNVWHLTHFVRHYEATAAALFADAKAGATMDAMHGASDHRWGSLFPLHVIFQPLLLRVSAFRVCSAEFRVWKWGPL